MAGSPPREVITAPRANPRHPGDEATDPEAEDRDEVEGAEDEETDVVEAVAEGADEAVEAPMPRHRTRTTRRSRGLKQQLLLRLRSQQQYPTSSRSRNQQLAAKMTTPRSASSVRIR